MYTSGASLPRKKSFRWNKSGGRQLVEMHGIRSVKGKAEAGAQQFRLECVYADASYLPRFRFFSPSLRLGYNSRSYYFSSVLVPGPFCTYINVDTTKRTKEEEEGRTRKSTGRAKGTKRREGG